MVVDVDVVVLASGATGEPIGLGLELGKSGKVGIAAGGACRGPMSREY